MEGLSILWNNAMFYSRKQIHKLIQDFFNYENKCTYNEIVHYRGYKKDLTFKTLIFAKLNRRLPAMPKLNVLWALKEFSAEKRSSTIANKPVSTHKIFLLANSNVDAWPVVGGQKFLSPKPKPLPLPYPSAADFMDN